MKEFYFAKNLLFLFRKEISQLLTLIGAICTIKQLLEILGIIKEDTIIIQKIIIIIIITIGCIIIFMKNHKNKYEKGIEGKDIKIELCIGDILKQNVTIIIPTNSTFDTKLENEFISKKSVQGQMETKYFKNNIKELDKIISKELKNNKNYTEITDKKYSKKREYAIGTTVEINIKNKRFYLLADSNVNSKGQVIDKSLDSITNSLSSLWKYIAKNGHVEEIAIPLIGTGRMGIKDSREDIIKKIISSFIKNNINKKIATKLIICIKKDDIKTYNINMEEIKEYLNYNCKYYGND